MTCVGGCVGGACSPIRCLLAIGLQCQRSLYRLTDTPRCPGRWECSVTYCMRGRLLVLRCSVTLCVVACWCYCGAASVSAWSPVGVITVQRHFLRGRLLVLLRCSVTVRVVACWCYCGAASLSAWSPAGVIAVQRHFLRGRLLVLLRCSVTVCVVSCWCYCGAASLPAWSPAGVIVATSLPAWPPAGVIAVLRLRLRGRLLVLLLWKILLYANVREKKKKNYVCFHYYSKAIRCQNV